MTSSASAMPSRNQHLLLSVALTLSCLAIGCSRVSVTPAAQHAYASRADCRIAWEHTPQADAAKYEWVGEVALEHHDGHIKSTDRAVLEKEACGIGGDLVSLASRGPRKDSPVTHYGTAVFNVYRVRPSSVLDDQPHPTSPTNKQELAAARGTPAP